jgi:hypothetical protein
MASGVPFEVASVGNLEEIMQMAITFMAVIGGMVFSLAVALLAEELIFGQVFRLFFAQPQLQGQKVAPPAMRSTELVKR